jgi:regulatory protein
VSGRGTRTPPRPPTRERLHARALRYLERFAATEAHLRRVLLRRALRDAEALGLEPAPIRCLVDEVVARVVAAGLIDDRLFAQARARRLVEGGRSPQRIRATLAAKGLGAEAVTRALERLGEEQGDVELAAAIAYARRRRLGPWRPADERAESQVKDLAGLARAGFSYRVARLVVDAKDPEALDASATG